MAVTTYTTKFYYYNSTFLSVGSVESVKISLKSSTVDTTDLSCATRTFMKGIADAGEVALSLNIDPANTAHKYLRDALFDNPGTTAKQFKVLFSNSEFITFYGFVTDFSINAALDEKLQADISIKVTGPLAYA